MPPGYACEVDGHERGSFAIQMLLESSFGKCLSSQRCWSIRRYVFASVSVPDWSTSEYHIRVSPEAAGSKSQSRNLKRRERSETTAYLAVGHMVFTYISGCVLINLVNAFMPAWVTLQYRSCCVGKINDNLLCVILVAWSYTWAVETFAI